MKLQRAGDLMTAIAILPSDHYVKFNKEQSDEDDSWFLTACVFKQAPEDGWVSDGDRFQHPPDWPSHQRPCPEHSKHDDCVLFGVNADVDKPEVVERLLINAIKERWGAK
jgi:hypothetical protein